MKLSLHAQAIAVDVVSNYARRQGEPRLKRSQWDHLEPGISAGARTLMLLQSWRDRLPAAFLAEIEG